MSEYTTAVDLPIAVRYSLGAGVAYTAAAGQTALMTKEHRSATAFRRHKAGVVEGYTTVVDGDKHSQAA